MNNDQTPTPGLASALFRRQSRDALAARRMQLQQRSTQLRRQIAQGSHVFQPAARVADRVSGVADQVRQHARQQGPFLMLLISALAGASLVRPRLLMGLGLRAWSGWQAYLRLRPLAQGFMRGLARGRSWR